MPRSVVSFHFTLRDSKGQILDSSIGGQPIGYLEGGGQIIDGLEEALHGLVAGTKRAVLVAAEKAYGARDEQLIRRVPRRKLPVDQISLGDRFQTEGDRHAAIVTVVGIEGDEVLLDANHPLAGQDLFFDVEVLTVREARSDEIEHGHVHGPDGHGHSHGHEHGHHGHGGGCGCGHSH